jgi:type I restriction-modification system DNA methylase subunit
MRPKLNTTWHTLATEWPKMDRIYTNVPFGIKIQDPNILNSFDVGKTNGHLKGSELSQLLFLEKCLRQLTPTGKLATVVDKGVATNDKYVRERKYLTTLAHLDLVVELPGVALEYFAGTTFPRSGTHQRHRSVEHACARIVR